jgi:CrcB protein
MQLACVALGGALGALLRAVASDWLRAHLGARWPWGTLLVNLAGCLALGALAAHWEWGRSAPGGPAPLLRPLLAVGLIGGFTTFSTFGVETLELLRQDRAAAALAYVSASVVCGIGAAGLGAWVVRWVV